MKFERLAGGHLGRLGIIHQPDYFLLLEALFISTYVSCFSDFFLPFAFYVSFFPFLLNLVFLKYGHFFDLSPSCLFFLSYTLTLMGVISSISQLQLFSVCCLLICSSI